MTEVFYWIKVLFLVLDKQDLAVIGFYNQGLNPWLTLFIVTLGAYAGLAMIYLLLKAWPLKKARLPRVLILYWNIIFEWMEIGIKALRKWQGFNDWERAVASYRMEEKLKRDYRIRRFIVFLTRVGYLGLAIGSVIPIPLVGYFLVIGASLAGLKHAFLIIAVGLLIKLSLLVYLVYHHGEKIFFLAKLDFNWLFLLLVTSYVLYLIIGLSRHIAKAGGINNFRT